MLRPFVPAKDYEQSRQFYESLGFVATFADDRISVMSNGRDSFLLQNFYVAELAKNLMLQLTVDDASAWWTEYGPEDLAARLGTKPPSPPVLQPWGRVVGFVHDPSGVLWHITELAS
jgi:uncharacterized glyoxalase superfamily protein PhnB